jgi:hypothetical protein
MATTPYPTERQHIMTTSPKAPKGSIVIKAPKITSAWLKVVATSNAGEDSTIKSIENLSAVMVLESRLTVRDIKKVITDSGKSCGMISVSHVPALPTWSKLRALHKDFKALPLAKQLSTATASYDLLGAGNGEQVKSLDALNTAIKGARKAKAEKAKEGATTPAKEKKAKNTLADILAYFTALDYSTLTETQLDTVTEIHAVLEGAMINA